MPNLRHALGGASLAVIVGLAPAAAMVGWSADAAAGTLHRGNAAEPQTLDPARATGVPESNIMRDLYETLVYHTVDGGIMPGAAESWTISDDGLTYTFTMRPEAVWSNGDPVTAHDFVFSYQRLVAPETASRFAWLLNAVVNGEEIQAGDVPAEELAVVALDDHTLQITLDNPTPFFIELLKHGSLSPVHRPSVEAHGERFTRPGNLVSNGPFVLTEWLPQSHVRIERNETFHAADEVALDAVYYYPTPDLAAELSRFRAGELDMTYNAPADQMPWLRENMPDELRNPPWFGTYYITVNTQLEALSDPRLRRALALAIDRNAIVTHITQSGELPAYSWVPPGANDGSIDYDMQTVDFVDMPMEDRVAEAQAIMAELGYSEDNPLELEYVFNTSDLHRNIAIALASMWQPLGVEVELRNLEWQVYLDTTARAEHEVARAGWVGVTYGDASYFLEKFHPDAGEANSARYDNAEFGRLLNQARVTADPQARTDMMEQAEAIMMQDLPIIPIYHYATRRMVGTHVEGVVDNVRNVHASRFISIAE